MKKLMIAACAIAFAAVSQAASVDWGAAACDADNWENDITGNYAYLLLGSVDADLATSITLATAGISGDAIIGSVADNGYKVVASHQFTSAESLAGAFKDAFGRSDDDGGVNGYYQIILANGNTTKFAVAKADQNPVSGITDSTGAGVATYNDNWNDGSQYIGDQGWQGEFKTAGIPEPTSGLLLLLGVAGLALRRRRA